MQQGFRLADNSGAVWSDLLPAGQGTTPLGNSQCRVKWYRSVGTYTLADLDFYLYVNVEFQAAFAGVKNIYLQAVDSSGLTSGWQNMGTWKVFVNEAPSAVSVTPSTGSGLAQVFRVTARDANGADDIYQISLTVARAGDTQVCAALVDFSTSRASLLRDDLSWMSMVFLSSKVALQNSYCGLDTSGVEWGRSGNEVVVDIPLVFNPAFTGAKDLTAAVRDSASSTMYKLTLGKWTIPSSNCAYAAEPGGAQVGPNRTSGVFNVATEAGCPWVASSDASWLTVVSRCGGTGRATVSYAADFNVTAAQRTGSIRINGSPFQVVQDGRAQPLGPPTPSGASGTPPFFNGADLTSALASGSWITFLGTDLAPTTRVWTDQDFVNGRLPS